MRGNADNIGSCVEKRVHESLSPEPMYLRNDIGHKAYKELGAEFKTVRQKSTVRANDFSNKTGDRARGGY